MSENNPGFATLAIHAGAQPDPTTGARITPIYQTTAYVFNDSDHAANLFALKEFGNIYTRIMNPTQGVLEERIAALEGGTAALAVASGHAAQLLIFHSLMQPGDNFVAAKKLYGGSINQFGHAFKNFGWQVRWADPADPESFAAQIDDKTKAVYIESLANPGGTFVDIAAIAEVAHRHGLPLIVDNTMASPYLIRPLEHGADIIVHSVTKFLGGHGNSMGGVIVDGGTFDWSATSGKYPMLSEPRPEYNGVVLHQTFGNFAFAIACRVLGLRAAQDDLPLALLLDGRFHQIADDGVDIFTDVADLGELGGLDLDEGRIGQLGQAARDLGLAHAGRADHQDVLRRDLAAHLFFDLLAPPAVAQRDGHGALGIVLADDVAVEFRHDLLGRHAHASTSIVWFWLV